MRIASLDQAASVDGPMLAEGRVGRNGDPRSKVDQFVATVRSQAGRKVADMAFMKFCYVDFDPKTNVDDLLSSYRSALESLKKERPEIRFAHVTVPLMRQPIDLKSRLLRLVGSDLWEDSANVKRSEFSRRLKEAFPFQNPTPDIATLEATGPDGQPVTFRKGRAHLPEPEPALHGGRGPPERPGPGRGGRRPRRDSSPMGFWRPRDAR